ncbi:MAG: A24 family peptidase [Actinomycetota bacterium]|nr:A24 family peptidase [Actinomycetota bacterium]MDA3028176.1 A24 family peptidase [Actinomycetota bacterium]
MLGYLTIVTAILSAAIWFGIVWRPASRALTESASTRATKIAPATAIALTVLVSILLTIRSQPAATTISLIVVGTWSTGAMTQTVVDASTRRLPLRISHLTALMLAAATILDAPSRTVSIAAGAVAMTAITLALTRLTRGSLGRGDVHFSPMLGVMIGWSSPWPDLLSALIMMWLITTVTAALVTLGGLALRRLDRGSTIPYGPFMALGTLVVVASALGATP